MLNAFDPFPHVRLTDQLYFPISPGFSNKIARMLSETPHPQSNNKSLITLFPYPNLKLDQEQWLPRTASFPLSFSFFQQLAVTSTHLKFLSAFSVSNRTQNILSTAICADYTDSNRGILRILLLLCFHPHLGKKGSLGMRNTVQCKLPSIMEGDWSQSFSPFPALNLLLAS